MLGIWARRNAAAGGNPRLQKRCRVCRRLVGNLINDADCNCVTCRSPGIFIARDNRALIVASDLRRHPQIRPERPFSDLTGRRPPFQRLQLCSDDHRAGETYLKPLRLVIDRVRMGLDRLRWRLKRLRLAHRRVGLRWSMHFSIGSHFPDGVGDQGIQIRQVPTRFLQWRNFAQGLLRLLIQLRLWPS